MLGPGDEAMYVRPCHSFKWRMAEEGAGDDDAAMWHWDMAQTLFPKLAETDLSLFGAPGETLKRNIPSNPTAPARLHTCRRQRASR